MPVERSGGWGWDWGYKERFYTDSSIPSKVEILREQCLSVLLLRDINSSG